MVTCIFIDEWHKYLFPFNTKIDLSDQSFIKYDVFEATVIFSSRGNTIGIIAQCCKHQNMSDVSHINNNTP